MWLVFLIPGPFYSVWRATGKKLRCAACGSELLAELESTVGKRLAGIVDKQIAGEIPASTKERKITKPDPKALAAVQGAVGEAIRQETGMSLERGLGESCHPAERNDCGVIVEGKIALQQVRGDSDKKSPTQCPRSATQEQKPEDW